MVSRRRRTILVTLGATTVAGCLGENRQESASDSESGPESASRTALAKQCPKSQDLEVTWPTDLTASSAEEFISSYAVRYAREYTDSYESKSQLDSYELTSRVTSVDPVEQNSGYQIDVTVSGGIYTPSLTLETDVVDSSGEREPVPIADVDGELRGLLIEAPEDGATRTIVPRGPEIDAYIDSVDSVSETFDGTVQPVGTETVYFDVNGTVVSLTLINNESHADVGRKLRYYVDDCVVWRTSDPDGAPTEGTLLECRMSEQC